MNSTFTSTNFIEQFLSQDNFQRAYEKVALKRGCAGTDEQTIDDFSQNLSLNLTQLRNQVAEGSYQPQPCKQVFIPKLREKWRELKIPTVRDRIVQQALLNVLAPIAERQFSRVSFAYRPNRSYLDAVQEVIRWRDRGFHWVLDADIVEYFDQINHAILLREVRNFIDYPGILCLIKAWISVGISTNKGVLSAEKGIPQGAVISPLLANIYLNDFDHRFSQIDSLKLIRYADDFLILARTEWEISEAYSRVEKSLHSLALELHSRKTQITHFERGFRFLGHGFLEQAIFPLESASSSQSESEELTEKTVKKNFFHSLAQISEKIRTKFPIEKEENADSSETFKFFFSLASHWFSRAKF
ncbi:MAG: group II intron reverse transcriptase/maturase [Cyanobacteria bacterium J06592_8]